MPELMSAALEYAKMGFMVLPLKPGDKTPITDHAVKDATGNYLQIRDWWTKNPDYNIGLAMGNGFICLDFDEDETKGKHGLETLRSWEMEHGKKLPDTWIHLTPRGGVHYIYRDPFGYRSREKLYHDIELRSDGLYIAAPPSRRSDGKMYEWECGYSPEDMEVSIIDDIVKEFLIGEVPETEKEGFTVPVIIPDGERHIDLMRMVGWMANIGLSDDTIRAAVSIENNLRCEPPLTDRELEKTIFPALNNEWDINKPYYERRDDYWKTHRELYLKDRKIELLEQLLNSQSSTTN